MMIALFLLSAGLLSGGLSGQHAIHVSPSGNRATLEAVQREVRELKRCSAGDIVVWLADGTYELERTLVFTPDDGGSDGRTVRWCAMPGAHPVLSGARRVAGPWTPVPDRPGVVSAEFVRDRKLRSLYVNGRRATMSVRRCKSLGAYGKYAFRRGDGAWAWDDGEVPAGVRLDYSKVLLGTRNPDDVELETRRTWNTDIVCVSRFEPLDVWSIAAHFQMPYAAIAQQVEVCKYDCTADQYVRNVYEWMENPGDFYFDRRGGRLYYMLRDGETPETVEAYVPHLETLVAVRGSGRTNRVQNLVFEGIGFAHTDWNLCEVGGSHGRSGLQGELFEKAYLADAARRTGKAVFRTCDVGPSAVSVENGRGIVLRGCTVRCTAVNGIGLVNDCVDVRLEGNAILRTGGSAVVVGHPQNVYIGDRDSGLGIRSDAEKYAADVEGAATGVVIRDNVMVDLGESFWGDCGVMVFMGSGLDVSRNWIENTPYSGISVGWCWGAFDGREKSLFPGRPYLTTHGNRFCANAICNTLLKLADGGAIYTLGLMRDTTMDGNFIGGIGDPANPPSYHIRGIHVDEGTQFLKGGRNVIDILPKYVGIDCGFWGSGTKGNNAWTDNYTTSGRYSSEERMESNTVISACHVVRDRRWGEREFGIVQAAGPAPEWFGMVCGALPAADVLLPCGFRFTGGSEIRFRRGIDAPSELWLKDETAMAFAEGDRAAKVAPSGEVRVPKTAGVYRLYVCRDGSVSRPSRGFIAVERERGN